MIKRLLATKLKQLSGKYPAVLLTGPRQSGKTTLCRQLFAHKPYLNFEDPDIRDLAENDPRGLLSKYPDGAVFDEIQRCPKILSYLQGIIDAKGKNGMFILTGSQNILLLKSAQQSLAGRVAILKLLPFSLTESQTFTRHYSLERTIYTGGFPRLYTQKLNPTETMSNYVASYLERDVRNIINVKSLSLFQKFLKLCAGRIGQIVNLSSISNDLGVSHTTLREWMSVLESSYIVYLLPAYYRNFNKRIIKSPKLYFTDVGMACYLLGIDHPQQVTRDPLYGSLVENLIITEFLKYFWGDGREAPLYYFRDNAGNEVDLIIEKARKVVAVEIKGGQTFNSNWSKGLEYIDKVMKKDVLSKHIFYAGSENYEQKGISISSYKIVKKLYTKIAA